MKKFAKKLTLAIVLVLACVLSLATIVACNENGGDDNAHKHTYSKWAHDAENHWRVCPKDNEIKKSSVANHADEDGDGVCDVCGYDGMHEHSYDSYGKDANNHWVACSCGERQEGAEDAAHVDEDSDGICDVCGYDSMHVHSYNAYDYDEYSHWTACSCGEKQEGAEEVAHVDDNQDGVCDVCGCDSMHAHDYVWAFDADNHWHYCIGCDDVEAGSSASHVDEDNNLKCDVCGYEYKYAIVTVKDKQGNCIADVELHIGEYDAVTDENGMAKFDSLPSSQMRIWVSNLPEKYVECDSYYATADKHVYEIIITNEITNTFVVEASEPMADVTLKLMDGEDVIASGKTDENGEVTLTYPVGASGEKYYYAIEGLTEDQYLSNKAGISKATISSKTIGISVYTRQYETYTIAVACDEGVEYELEGITVEIWKQGYNATLIASGKTNVSGIATIKAEKSSNSYIAKINGLNEGYKAEEVEVGYDWWEGTTITEATLTIKKSEATGGGEGGDQGSSNVLNLGTTSVTGYVDSSSYDPITEYVFTSVAGGTYKVYSENGDCFFTYGGEYYYNNMDCVITLEAGASAIIKFGTGGYLVDHSTYDVVVEEITPIPSVFQGSWIDEENDATFEIGVTTVVDNNGIEHQYKNITIVNDYEISISAKSYDLELDDYVSYTLTINYVAAGDAIHISKDGVAIYAMGRNNSVLSEIPEIFIGTWTGYDDYNEEDVVIIITSDVVNDGSNDNTLANGWLEIVSGTELLVGDLSFKYDADTKQISVYADDEFYYSLTKQSSSEGDGEGEGSGSGSEGDEEPAEAIFPEGLQGKWSYSIDEIIVEIFAGAIKMGGAECNIEDSVTSDNITYYNFSVNGNTRYGIYQDGEDWYMGQYGQGILRDAEKLIAVTGQEAQ